MLLSSLYHHQHRERVSLMLLIEFVLPKWLATIGIRESAVRFTFHAADSKRHTHTHTQTQTITHTCSHTDTERHFAKLFILN